VADGSPEGLVRIPAIGVDQVFVEGTGTAELRRGPGHYSGTPMPGQPGNAALAGHRTTYGAPFNQLDRLRPGDPILITTSLGSFRYDVRRSFVVKPSDVWVIAPTPGDQLTLTTCTPRFSASRRLIVQASLVGSPAPAAPISQPPQLAASSGRDSAAPWVSLGGWGLAAIAVAIVASSIANRRRRRWPVYVLLAPVFLAALAMLFASASAVLPDML
jgi:sortase A